MDARLFTAVIASKTLRTTIRLLGGGATAAPGLLAEYIDSTALQKLAKYYTSLIFVTGTNGKTTTARLLGNILEYGGFSFIHNRSGSNLLRGIIGALIDNFGNRNTNIALLEADEATLPSAIRQTNPNIIIFNNLFRDQLDRYGEVDKIRSIWQKALIHLDPKSVIILNSDDHSVAHLGKGSKATVIYFGLEDKNLSIGKPPHASDFTNCIACGKQLTFDEVYMAHLGKYRCPDCSLIRPKPDIYASSVKLIAEKGFEATISTPKGEIKIKSQLPGLYNVYNCLAAATAGIVLGIKLEKIKEALELSTPAFGRTERLELDGKKIFIGLVKNPTGFNEVIRTVFEGSGKKNILIAINDLIADGKDVSWLWDVDFEFIVSKIRKVWISGIRASDMALRLKYTGAKKLETHIDDNLETAVAKAIDGTQIGDTLYILPTYTAMLKLKKILAEAGVSSQFWED
ncbi:MAG: hypothetical protein A2172_04435 [Candidatus Woykebacteria bacterium RBG_13_40_15]|uniref:Lipid II isoglutaminyl synthase (glutamine-hydrolyzing) subunit MurT n=1 Tax=Candidatus Woykebacteria bacterium RBG_13_40_15 TaxID=1802593 RepID=A0A1G1W6Y7_9BACT|nr:MAG: hypothetical protein A2172_04435 [Candidatus Woykebacteria bacterium RBG_13_40_15]